MMDLLVESGADLTLPKKSDGLSALHIAASTNDIQLMDFIFERLGANETRSQVN